MPSPVFNISNNNNNNIVKVSLGEPPPGVYACAPHEWYRRRRRTHNIVLYVRLCEHRTRVRALEGWRVVRVRAGVGACAWGGARRRRRRPYTMYNTCVVYAYYGGVPTLLTFHPPATHPP